MSEARGPTCPRCGMGERVVKLPDSTFDWYCVGCACTWDPDAPELSSKQTRPFKYQVCSSCYGDGRAGAKGEPCPTCAGFGEELIEIGWADLERALLSTVE